MKITLLVPANVKSGQMPGTVRVVIEGDLPTGSAGNEPVRKILAVALDGLALINGQELVYDFTSLNLTYCDAVASLWLQPMSHGVRVFLIATGDSNRHLQNLMAISLAVPCYTTWDACASALGIGDMLWTSLAK